MPVTIDDQIVNQTMCPPEKVSIPLKVKFLLTYMVQRMKESKNRIKTLIIHQKIKEIYLLKIMEETSQAGNLKPDFM